jgi:hypothetical protein
MYQRRTVDKLNSRGNLDQHILPAAAGGAATPATPTSLATLRALHTLGTPGRQEKQKGPQPLAASPKKVADSPIGRVTPGVTQGVPPFNPPYLIVKTRLNPFKLPGNRLDNVLQRIHSGSFQPAQG